MEGGSPELGSGEGGRERPPLIDADLERFRRSGIRLDREGRFWHEGSEVTHEGIRRAFLRWLDRLGDGRTVLRFDGRRYVYVELAPGATPLLVTAIRRKDEELHAITNDGVEQRIDPTTIVLDRDGGARCTVRSGLEARLLSPAYYTLASWLEPVDGGAAAILRLGERRLRVPVRGRGQARTTK